MNMTNEDRNCENNGYQMTPLSLQTLCILHLPEGDIQYLRDYSSEVIRMMRYQFWEETTRHPDPLHYSIASLWIE